MCQKGHAIDTSSLWQQLRKHTKGKNAISDLKNFFYKNDTTFTFEKYATKLKGGFNVLEKYVFPIYEDQMVEYLLDQIMSPNTELET